MPHMLMLNALKYVTLYNDARKRDALSGTAQRNAIPKQKKINIHVILFVT